MTCHPKPTEPSDMPSDDDGYVRVPREPTEAMILAGERAGWDHSNCMPAIRGISKSWAAMIAVATTTPTPIQQYEAEIGRKLNDSERAAFEAGAKGGQA